MNWDEAADRLDRSVAGVFDTAVFTVAPTMAGLGVNSARMTDIRRAPFVFAGTIELGAPRQASSPQNPRSILPFPGGESMPAHEAVITAFAGDWPYRPRGEDRIVIVSVRGASGLSAGDTFVIAVVQSDGSPRLALHINRAKAT